MIAALLGATSPMLLMLSGSLMSHDLSLFLTIAFCLAWFDLFPRGGGAARSRRRCWWPSPAVASA